MSPQATQEPLRPANSEFKNHNYLDFILRILRDIKNKRNVPIQQNQTIQIFHWQFMTLSFPQTNKTRHICNLNLAINKM